MWTFLLTFFITLGLLITVLLIMSLLFGTLYRASSKWCSKRWRMDGRVVIVTGSSAGLGKETALDLAGRGARVIMACRNLSKAQAVADEIIKKSGNTKVIVRQLELSDFQSVRKFAKQINEEENAVHVLINNAGTGGYDTREMNADGHELTMATNHFGPFLLTLLLLDKLKASASSRIINVSSIYYIKNELDLADINFERRKYSFLRAYCQSKLANILFTKELARRLHGTGVVANCLHPGNGDTDILKGPNPNTRKFIRQIVARFGAYLCRTAEQAAQTQIYLAVSEEGGTQSGCYYSNCEKSNLYFGANDMDLGKRLWDASCLAVQLAPEETIREVMEDAAPNSRVQPHKQ